VHRHAPPLTIHEHATTVRHQLPPPFAICARFSYAAFRFFFFFFLRALLMLCHDARRVMAAMPKSADIAICYTLLLFAARICLPRQPWFIFFAVFLLLLLLSSSPSPPARHERRRFPLAASFQPALSAAAPERWTAGRRSEGAQRAAAEAQKEGISPRRHEDATPPATRQPLRCLPPGANGRAIGTRHALAAAIQNFNRNMFRQVMPACLYRTAASRTGRRNLYERNIAATRLAGRPERMLRHRRAMNYMKATRSPDTAISDVARRRFPPAMVFRHPAQNPIEFTSACHFATY